MKKICVLDELPPGMSYGAGHELRVNEVGGIY